MSRRLPFHSNAVWPPAGLILVFALAYGFMYLPLWFLERAAAHGGTTIPLEDELPFLVIRLGILCLAAAVFALFRLWRFHPACNPAYLTWLKLSPWTAAKPLPLGPVHLVWQDAAVVGLLAAFTWAHAHANPVYPVISFAVVYFLGFTLLLAGLHRWAHCVALGFLWPALLLPVMQGVPGWVIILAIVAVIWHGHRQSLRAFPWECLEETHRFVALNLQIESPIRPSGTANHSPPPADNSFNLPLGAAAHRLGWPFQALSPKIKPSSISPITNLALGTLLGWWSFCIITASGMDPLPELILLAAVVGAGLRLAIYAGGTAPPFNVWGRLVSGRIVIPGYDQIFLTPLAGVATATLGLILVKYSGRAYPAVEAGTIAAIWFVLFGGGPTRRSWLLIGQHRLRPLGQLNANKRLIRPI